MRDDETPAEHDRAEGLRRERFTRAADLRLEQALRDQKVDLTLASHATEIRELTQGHLATSHSLLELRGQLTKLVDTLPQVISKSIEAALDKQTSKALSSRQLWLATFAVLVPLVALFLHVRL